jgi:protein arginine N-methyltransferase 1
MSYGYADHLAMMRDERRLDAYRRAIAVAVRPGDVAIDVGAGCGVLTFLALAAGAARVHAIEPSPNVEVLAQVARASGLAERVCVHRADSRRIALAEPGDVLLADLRGALPVHDDGVAVLADARRRLLRPGGRVVPARDRLWLAPATCQPAQRAIDGWRLRVGDADYASMMAVAAAGWSRQELGAGQLLAAGARGPELDYAQDPPSALVFEHQFAIERAGELHGLAAWFEATLVDGVVLSTAPEHGVTVHGQGLFPLQRAVAVAPGDSVHARWRVDLGPVASVWRWRIAWRTRGGSGAEEHCSLDAELGSLAELRRRAAGHRPRLGAEGTVLRQALELMATGDATLAEIAATLERAHADRFPLPGDALAYVGELSAELGLG